MERVRLDEERVSKTRSTARCSGFESLPLRKAYRPGSSVVERRPYKADVRGSTPRPGTVAVAQR